MKNIEKLLEILDNTLDYSCDTSEIIGNLEPVIGSLRAVGRNIEAFDVYEAHGDLTFLLSELKRTRDTVQDVINGYNVDEKLDIDGFPSYYYLNGCVLKRKDDCHITLTKTLDSGDRVKLKHANGKWKSLSINTVRKLAGLGIKIPVNAKKIPFTKHAYVTPKGEVYIKESYNQPLGFKATVALGDNGYYRVSINYKGKRRNVELHQLLAVTFIDRDYIENGLCVMHEDDNKLNIDLDNLSVGTYSKNNLDAYKTGINKGRRG